MRVLLDECVDRRLARELNEFDVHTVVSMGWKGITNGELLGLAVPEFDVFVTVDRNLSFQQHLPRYEIAVILVECISNRLADLKPIVPRLIEAIPTAPRGTVTRVGL